MTLTGQGYVALGAQTAPVKKFNPHHDERGRFASADGGGGASGSAKPRERTAQGSIPEEENRDAEEPADPLAEVRGQEWAKSIATLRALDPKNPNLTYAAAPDWVPTDRDIADLNAEIARVTEARVSAFIMPGGKLMGVRTGSGVREAPGGAPAARAAFDYLKVGGTPYTGDYPGEMVILPSDVGSVGFRYNDQGIPTLDIKVLGIIRQTRFHYRGN